MNDLLDTLTSGIVGFFTGAGIGFTARPYVQTMWEKWRHDDTDN